MKVSQSKVVKFIRPGTTHTAELRLRCQREYWDYVWNPIVIMQCDQNDFGYKLIMSGRYSEGEAWKLGRTFLFKFGFVEVVE